MIILETSTDKPLKEEENKGRKSERKEKNISTAYLCVHVMYWKRKIQSLPVNDQFPILTTSLFNKLQPIHQMRGKI